MFTGIVEEVGQIAAVEEGDFGRNLRITANLAPALALGQSVCVSGACLTVTAALQGTFSCTAVPETVRKTTLGLLKEGTEVNLERAMPATGRFEGHVVQGHVDYTAVVTEVGADGKDRLYSFVGPPGMAPYLVPRGSITVDGISLTLARVSGSSFTVAIIPHTFQHTTARNWADGMAVNVECDVLGKYVIQYLSRTQP